MLKYGGKVFFNNYFPYLYNKERYKWQKRAYPLIYMFQKEQIKDQFPSVFDSVNVGQSSQLGKYGLGSLHNFTCCK